MAVEAARDALKSAPPGDVQALIFATTTPPYAEKLSAAVIGAAAQLPAEIRASDMTGSVRAGMSAILQGADAVSGGAKRALVAIGDCRLAAPEGKAEQTTGDGAVAFVLGADNVIAEIEASASLTREFLDTWRATRRALCAFMGRALHADPGAFAAARHRHQERARESESRAQRSVEDNPRRAQRPRSRRDRARAQNRSRKILRLICVDRRTDRRRACGPDALRRAAVRQARRSNPRRDRRRRRRRDPVPRHARQRQLQAGAFRRPHDRVQGRRLLRQLSQVARDSAD